MEEHAPFSKSSSCPQVECVLAEKEVNLWLLELSVVLVGLPPLLLESLSTQMLDDVVGLTDGLAYAGIRQVLGGPGLGLGCSEPEQKYGLAHFFLHLIIQFH